VLALAMYRAQLCPSGHYLPESGNAANEDRYAASARRCHACTAVARRAEALAENPQPGALLYGVERR
jgi:hypothetical protein